MAHISPTREVQMIGWVPPRIGWLKLNVDGAVKRPDSKGAAGGVMRDADGKWVCGFTANLGITLIVESELWGVFLGLKMAWERNAPQVEVESDLKIVVKPGDSLPRLFETRLAR
ncbi:hypothetical protein V2J09_012638 [Rumex salicifolius]